MDESAETAT
ncbi:hypothetical protein CLOM_g14687, partial [Closterium sp. NIES-68]